MTAWQTAHLINIHIAKGPPVTMRKLLGPEFFDAGPESEEFKTKVEWAAHKAALQKMARFHSRALRALRAGKREGKETTVATFFKDIKARDQ